MDRCFGRCFAARPTHGLAVNRDDTAGNAGLRRHPRDETVLELLGIQRREDIADPVMRWRSVTERAEPAQQGKPFGAEPGDVGEGFCTRKQG